MRVLSGRVKSVFRLHLRDVSVLVLVEEVEVLIVPEAVAFLLVVVADEVLLVRPVVMESRMD